MTMTFSRSSRCAVPFTAALRVIHCGRCLREVIRVMRVTGR